jgi:lipoate-protein ligase A
MLENWRLVDLEYSDPYTNLAVEEAIMKAVGENTSPPTVHFWRNVRPTIVLGRFQNAAFEINSLACAKYGIAVVRRFTGGGTVYHDQGNLNYSISISKSHVLVSNNMFNSIAVLLRGVLQGLQVLGFVPEFEPPGSIKINGKKVSGIAGAIRWGAIFYHGTMLVNSNLEVLSEALQARDSRNTSNSTSSRHVLVTTLQDEARREVQIKEVKGSIRQGFEGAYGIKLLDGELSSRERDLVQQISRNR